MNWFLDWPSGNVRGAHINIYITTLLTVSIHVRISIGVIKHKSSYNSKYVSFHFYFQPDGCFELTERRPKSFELENPKIVEQTEF